jgi:hypothetical protein
MWYVFASFHFYC